MITIDSYKCECCGTIRESKDEMDIHETVCIAHKEHVEEMLSMKAKAYEYLNTFRHRALSVKHLFKLIDDEMPQVLEAYNTLKHFYNRNASTNPLRNFTWKPHGFAAETRPDMHPMTHSAPVGLDKCPMYPQELKTEALAFEIELFFDVERPSDLWSVLDAIPGINTGSAGNWRESDFHAYITFWVEDFPLFEAHK